MPIGQRGKVSGKVRRSLLVLLGTAAIALAALAWLWAGSRWAWSPLKSEAKEAAMQDILVVRLRGLSGAVHGYAVDHDGRLAPSMEALKSYWASDGSPGKQDLGDMTRSPFDGKPIQYLVPKVLDNTSGEKMKLPITGYVHVRTVIFYCRRGEAVFAALLNGTVVSLPTRDFEEAKAASIRSLERGKTRHLLGQGDDFIIILDERTGKARVLR